MKAIVYTEYGPPDVLQFEDVENLRPKKITLLTAQWALGPLIMMYPPCATIGRCIFQTFTSHTSGVPLV
jgi:hypothetical protein